MDDWKYDNRGISLAFPFEASGWVIIIISIL
jgi:hypothetical protein